MKVEGIDKEVTLEFLMGLFPELARHRQQCSELWVYTKSDEANHGLEVLCGCKKSFVFPYKDIRIAYYAEKKRKAFALENLREFLDEAKVQGKVEKVTFPPEFMFRLGAKTPTPQVDELGIRLGGFLGDFGDLPYGIRMMVDSRLRPGTIEVVMGYYPRKDEVEGAAQKVEKKELVEK